MTTDPLPVAPLAIEAALAQPRGYLSAWRGFTSHCERMGVSPLPATPDFLLDYLARRITVASAPPATLRWIVAAIRRAHDAAAMPRPDDPRIAALFSERARLARRPPIALDALRALGPAGVIRDRALDVDALRALLDACGTDPRGLRNRALLLTIHHGRLGVRRVVALDVDSVAVRPDLAVLRQVHVDPHLCPDRALRAWLAAPGRPSTGALFLSVHPREREPYGGRLYPADVHTALAQLSVAAGLPLVTPRALQRARGAQ